MGLQVPFAPYFLFFPFFVTIAIYLERLTNNVDKTRIQTL